MTIALPPPSQRAVDPDSGKWTDPWWRVMTALIGFANVPAAPSFTVTTLPSVVPAGKLIFVSNETGGPTLAFSNGTNWLRTSDNAIVS